MTPDAVRKRARETAAELRRRSYAAREITSTSYVRSVEHEGVFGLRKRVSVRRVEQTVGRGWSLHDSLPMRSVLVSGRNTLRTCELWLGTEGEVLLVERSTIYEWAGNEWTQVDGVRAASDRDLAIPCFQWEGVQTPPASRSPAYLEEIIWRQTLPIGTLYEETIRLIDRLAGTRATSP